METSFTGMAENVVRDQLGPPTSTTQFTLADGVTEFRIELLNTYSAQEDGARVFREQTWHDGGCRLTLWSTQEADQWTVKGGLTWPDDVEF